MGIELQNAIACAYQVKVTIDPGEKAGIFKKGVAPSTTFTFKKPDGQNANIKLVQNSLRGPEVYSNSVNQAKTYLTAMNAYSTKDDPNITPKEVFQIKENIARNTKGSYYRGYRNGGTLTNDSLKRSDYYQLLDLYSNSESDGGKDITPAEQAKIVDTFAKWYY